MSSNGILRKAFPGRIFSRGFVASAGEARNHPRQSGGARAGGAPVVSARCQARCRRATCQRTDLRRDPAAIRRRLGLHEGAAEFILGPTMVLPSGISFSSDLRVKLPDRFNVAIPFIDRHVAEGRGAKTAIRTRNETVAYGELAERVNRAGNALLARGLKPGDRLLMVVKDCPAFFYLFWCAIKAGIVPVPPNTLLRAPDYAYMFEDSGCRLVVYSSEFAGKIDPALKQVPIEALTADAFLDKMAKPSAQLTPHLASPDDDCFCLYSSGSTGPPKGAAHRHPSMVRTSTPSRPRAPPVPAPP